MRRSWASATGADLGADRVLPMDGRVAFDEEALTPAAAPPNPEKASPDALAALLPTGGTTGVPKIVPLTHRNIVASATATMLAYDDGAEDRFVIALPLFHVGGAFCGSLAAFGVGATMVLPTAASFRNPDVVANFWRIVEGHRATLGALVPTGSAPPPRRPHRAATLASAPVADWRIGLSTRDREAVPPRLAWRLRTSDLRHD